MTRKPLAAVETNIIVKDKGNGVTQGAVAREVDRHVGSVQRYLENLASRKRRR